MSTNNPSTTTWGDPNATKRALLIHGLTACSQCWTGFADILANLHGYYVIAPDLFGHGYASRPSTTDGGGYTVEKMSENLQSLLPKSRTDVPISLIIGHSFGSFVALDLLPSLSSNPRVVLVDPPLDLSPQIFAYIRTDLAKSVAEIVTVEQTAVANPLWKRRDAISHVTGKLLCDEEVVNAILDQNSHSSHTQRLPSDSATASITIIAGDPAFRAVMSADLVEDLKKSHPHIRTFAVQGASHHVHREFPEIVIREALATSQEHL